MITPYYSRSGIDLYLGDCRLILPQLTEKVDLVLTDPPYGLGSKLHDGGTWSTAKKYDAMLEWDTLTDYHTLESLTEYPAIIWGGQLICSLFIFSL